MTKLIVDSTCDLPAGYAAQQGITVLPLHIVVNGEEYLDGVDITTDEIYDWMRRGIMPATSQVGIADTVSTLEKLAADGSDLLYLAFSSKMSGTFALVRGILQEMESRYPGQTFCAVDSLGGSFATGLIAMQAAQMVQQGQPCRAIEARCLFLAQHVEHVFVITDLNWMVRGGRISRTMGYTANLFGIKPVLDVRDGEMEVICRARGHRGSLCRVADLTAQRAAACPCQLIGITHADDPAAAQEMQQLLAQRLPECRFAVTEIGAVLGVHIGIGGVGVFFFRDMGEAPGKNQEKAVAE